MVKKSKTYKQQAWVQLGALIAILILVNILISGFYFRIDLTKEKRFTLSEPTIQLLKNLEDVVYVRVYLEGDFPAGFKRLSKSTQEMLDDFVSYSNGRVEYEFIDPFEGIDKSQRQDVFDDLVKKGLQPTNLRVQGDEEYKQKIIFPGAIFTYKGKQSPIHLLGTQFGKGPEETLNSSIALLEYKLAKTIKTLTQKRKPKVAFMEGHGELRERDVADLAKSLSEFYQLFRFNIGEELTISEDYDAIVIAKPTQKFNEKDKFKIDQYIMHGGKVLWLIESLNAELDSLQSRDAYIALPHDLNLEDQLFKYGVRLNLTLVQDLYCAPIPMVIGFQGDIPQTQLFPWTYYPIISPDQKHPIVANLDALSGKFMSSIDTICTDYDKQQKKCVDKIKKTILLTSSQYSRVIHHPARIDLKSLQNEPDPELFKKPFQPTAVLLEGQFPSLFKNRLARETKKMLDTLNLSYKEKSDSTRMIIIADGDFIKNEYTSQGRAYPLGYNQYADQTFANKDFALNTLEYLIDEGKLIETRSKELKLRLLDKTRIKKEKVRWQLLNIGLPILLVILFGLLYNYIRRKKFAR